MKTHLLVATLLGLTATIACGGGDDEGSGDGDGDGDTATTGGTGSGAEGSEGGPCFANSTCNAGLQCLSDLCVIDTSGTGGGGPGTGGGDPGTGGGDGSGGGCEDTDICDRYCDRTTCTSDGTREQCVSACLQERCRHDGCTSEFDASRECLIVGGFECSSGGISLALANCQAEAEAYSACGNESWGCTTTEGFLCGCAPGVRAGAESSCGSEFTNCYYGNTGWGCSCLSQPMSENDAKGSTDVSQCPP